MTSSTVWIPFMKMSMLNANAFIWCSIGTECVRCIMCFTPWMTTSADTHENNLLLNRIQSPRWSHIDFFQLTRRTHTHTNHCLQRKPFSSRNSCVKLFSAAFHCCDNNDKRQSQMDVLTRKGLYASLQYIEIDSQLRFDAIQWQREENASIRCKIRHSLNHVKVRCCQVCTTIQMKFSPPNEWIRMGMARARLSVGCWKHFPFLLLFTFFRCSLSLCSHPFLWLRFFSSSLFVFIRLSLFVCHGVKLWRAVRHDANAYFPTISFWILHFPLRGRTFRNGVVYFSGYSLTGTPTQTHTNRQHTDPPTQKTHVQRM